MLAHLGAPNQLFHTPAGTAFADIPVKEHQETWPIRSKGFRTWLRRCITKRWGRRRAQRRSVSRSIS
jgi:hypothetical protein